MFSFDYLTKEEIKRLNLNWPQIPDHSYRILTVRGLDLEKQMYCLM